jgi:perosamine synthetase
MTIPLSKPDIGELEIAYVTKVLKSGTLSLGPCLRQFEEKFAAYVGARYAIATNSGTSALHLCVRALGIGSNDEVMTTSFSFVASTNCLLYEGALPAFVDIDSNTLNIDAMKIQEFVESNCVRRGQDGRLVDRQTGRALKAILPVHVFGFPCAIDAIVEVARKYGLMVIEDACEALGAAYDGRHVGTWGDVGVFAFYPNKQMTTGEGGMIVTDNEQIALLCRSMRNQGRDENSQWLHHVRLGYNYRLSDIQCALGLAQLERIDDILRARAAVAASYDRVLARTPLIKLPPPSSQKGKRSWFVYVVQVDARNPRLLRDRILRGLRECGIGCQSYFPAIHRQAYLHDMGKDLLLPRTTLPSTEAASDRCLALPFFSTESQREIACVGEFLQQLLEKEVGQQSEYVTQ